MLVKKIIIVWMLCISVTYASDSTQKTNTQTTEDAIKLKLISRVPRLQIYEITKSPIKNFYQLSTNSGVIYVSADGEYFLTGDLYGFTDTGITNLTEASLNKVRAQLLATASEKEMIVFAAPKDKAKATITVFTDIDCGYCRKLHSHINEMNDLGITVRYMAFPRAGIPSESYNKLVSAWCADNPQEALTQAKAGEEIPVKTCENPVAKQFELGKQMGIEGTPALILNDGTLVAGYVEPVELAQALGLIKANPQPTQSPKQ